MRKLEWRLACYALLDKPTECEHCGEATDVTLHYSRTAYHDKRMFPDGYGATRFTFLEVDLPEPSAALGEAERELDPNAPSWLCASCIADDESFWNEQWAEYYSGLL